MNKNVYVQLKTTKGIRDVKSLIKEAQSRYENSFGEKMKDTAICRILASLIREGVDWATIIKRASKDFPEFEAVLLIYKPVRIWTVDPKCTDTSPKTYL